METEIVITGMSGRFPESDNVEEFSQNLYNKKNLVTESTKRWEPGQYGLPRLLGQIKDVSKFDAGFFRVHHKQAHQLDPQSRLLLESTYESIIDSGYDPEELRGKNIGVFIGNNLSESLDYFKSDVKMVTSYTMTGCAGSMLANRISYTFDFKGPSSVMDTACSSSAMALHDAVNAIKNNECEAAIVGGVSLCLEPKTSFVFYKSNMLSVDGTCKSFDASANGYGRSEAVATLFIQKADVARRVYASIVNIKTNTDGFKDQGIAFPSADMQKRLIKEVYDECGLNPLSVSYVEAHGTGTLVGDPVEMSAISDIFCQGRKDPLLVGCVKSNMGHSEPASGLCGIVKVLIAMESRLLPPNLHFKSPNPNIPALIEGRVNIVSEPLPWKGGYASMNCFGFGGVNVHVVLKSNPKEREPIKSVSPFPQLVLYGGRTEEAIETVFDYLDKNPAPRDFFALLHKSAYASTQSKPYRGYTVLDQEEGIKDIKQLSVAKRAVWYIFSGMGTQWPAMAKDLMNFDVFSGTIHKLAKILKPYDLDLIELVTNSVTKKDNKRSIIPAFISIAAVQIALVDVLTELGVKPDGMVGHSVGELGCAYADGCLSAEQTILSAYWRGRAVEDANVIEGAMAALGMTWEEAKEQCPEAVFPSCHNAEDSITISGPQEDVQKFMEKLKAEDIFVREVNSCGYAFHSQYVFPAAEKLQCALESVIPTPKERTSRWVSSSYPEENWNDPKSKLANALYFVHNLVSPVLFCEALHHVPEDAIVIEIAPHHLLQAILKRVIGSKAEIIGLMKRYTNNSLFFLSSIGKMYISGLNPNIEKMYPAVSFPVFRGTPNISSLMKWDHSESWTVITSGKSGRHSQTVVEVDVSVPDSNDAYITHHCIDGRNLYPAAGYLMLAWKALAELKSKDVSSFPVAFEEVKIHRATVISRTSIIKFLVDITSVEGKFEISEAGFTVVTGRIFPIDEEEAQNAKEVKYWKDTTSKIKLNSSDIYKEFRLIGYDYGDMFQGIVESNIEGDQGLLNWNENWVIFLDTILQIPILSYNRTLRLSTGIENMKINPFLHQKVFKSTAKLGGIPVVYNRKTQMITAGGVEIIKTISSIAPRPNIYRGPLLEEYHFVPNNQLNVLSKSKMDIVERYVHACSSMVNKILQSAGKRNYQIPDIMDGFYEVKENVITDYLQNLTEEHVLLKNLQQMLSMIEKESKGLSEIANLSLSNYIEKRELDLLEKTLVDEIPLRTVLDVVKENTIHKQLNVLEAHDGNLPFSVHIHNVLQKFNTTPFNCTVAHPNPDSLDSKLLGQSGLKTVEWSTSSSKIPDIKNVDLLVIKILKSTKKEFKKAINSLSAALKDNGFLLLAQKTQLVPAEAFLSSLNETPIPVYSENDLEQIFDDLNLSVVSKKSGGIAFSLYLLRKIRDVASLANDVIIRVQVGNYSEWVEELKGKLATVKSNPENNRIWIVTENDANSGIVGLVNCLRQESEGASIRCIFTDPKSGLPAFDTENPAYRDIIKKDLLMNVYKNGTWGSFRHISINEQNDFTTQHAYVNVLTRGNLSSFKWIESPLKFYSSSPIPNTVLCQVYYAPLNFRDVMLASGKLPPDAIPGNLALQDCILGLEFSGRNTEGERVMGLVSAKGMATSVAADPDFMWKVPDSWSLEEASTVPMAYSTAYYALVIRGSMQSGEKVLIHSGSGGVGQAAIAIALSLGCQVFTSVGSKEKRDFLKKRFPQLTDATFCNSRDSSFEQHILNSTDGKGVDIVLNSLAEEKLKASLRCLAEHGRFLEIGKFDLSKNTPLGMAIFLKNISFHGILLDALFQNCNLGNSKKEVVELVNQGIRNGTVKPLNSVVFNNDEIEQAFRYMASGRHIGKVVLKIRDEEPEKIMLAPPIQLPVIPRTYCNPRKSYILIGGLGGFGLELCYWLIDRGAVNIVLTSRTGIRSGYQHLCLKRWKNSPANVVVSTLDAAYYDQAKQLLQLASNHGPIGGIFNLSLVLRDGFMENQTVENYELVCRSKVQSTVNLDMLSRDLCPSLDWFVCFSSISCGRGNTGQSNYGFANSVMERICEQRKLEGHPGLAIQWGPIGDVGVTYDTFGTDFMISGAGFQKLLSCLKVLDKFLNHNHPVVSSLMPYQPADRTQKSSNQAVLAIVANIFGIKDVSTINLESTLGELGMDSLVGVEIQQYLERHYDMAISFHDLRRMKMKDIKMLEGGPPTSSEETEENKKEHQSILGQVKELSQISDKYLVPVEALVQLNEVENGIPLFIVHPIEGVVAMLDAVAKSIQCPVFGLQYTADAPSTSVEDLALWYLTQIKCRHFDGIVNIAGYSFGACVAFEMALQAEHNPKLHPKIKSLIMLDGSPAFITHRIWKHKSNFLLDAEAENESHTLCMFMLQFTDLNMGKIKKELLKMSSFEDRISYTAEKISTVCTGVSKPKIGHAAQLFCNKIMMSLKYTPTGKLQHPITLIKTLNADVVKEISEKYDLEKVCSGKIEVHVVPGDHKNVIQGESAIETSKIINVVIGQ